MSNFFNNPYADIAPEYYDKILHPTCDYFGMLSAVSISNYVRDLEVNSVWVEVGAGASQISWPNNLSVISSDLNLGMLLQGSDTSRKLLVCNAYQMPLKPLVADGIVGSLADPYNDEKWWAEAHRILKRNGDLIFTVPSYAWAMQFRNSNNMMNAEFLTARGCVHLLPSYIYETQSQITKLTEQGFDFVKYLAVRKTGEAPPKVEFLSNSESVLDFYHFRKP